MPRPEPLKLEDKSGGAEDNSASDIPPPPTPSLSAVEIEPVADIFSLDVDKIKVSEIKWVGGGLGSTGVFVTRSDVGTFVAKPTSTRTAGEIYASILAEKLGIRSAKMAFQPDVQDAFLQKLRWAPSPNSTDKDRLRNMRTQSAALIEFVPGYALPACAMGVLAGPHRGRLLYEMGLVVLLDIVVNNFDRLPLVWSNEGNPDNIIISPGFEYPELWAIDHTLTCIKNAEGHQRYLDTIEAAMKELAADNYAGKSMSRVRESLLMCTGVELTRDDCDDICDGIRAGCVTLRELNETSPGWSTSIREQVLAILGPTYSPLCGGEDIDPAFVDSTTTCLLNSPMAKPL